MRTTATTTATSGTMTKRGGARAPRTAMTPLVAQAVRDRLPLVAAVSVLTVGMGLLVGALWPSLQGTFADLQDSLPDAFSTVLAGADLSTPSGWANAEMMSMLAPAAVITVAVISATKSTAGEEEAKTLGMLLGAPVARSSFLLAKAAATAVHVAIVALAIGAGLTLGNLVGGMGLGAPAILGASLHAAALGLLFGAVALTIGARTGSARITTASAAGLGGLSFALASFLPLSDTLADGAKVSPWYYYNSSNPLVEGADPVHLVVLLTGAALVLGLGTSVFRRRDLGG